MKKYLKEERKNKKELLLKYDQLMSHQKTPKDEDDNVDAGKKSAEKRKLNVNDKESINNNDNNKDNSNKNENNSSNTNEEALNEILANSGSNVEKGGVKSGNGMEEDEVMKRMDEKLKEIDGRVEEALKRLDNIPKHGEKMRKHMG